MKRETEKAAFLNRIIEAPEDDTARLVYADWLQENDEPERAEFIRVQIKLGSAEGEERSRLKERESSLLRKHRTVWTAEYTGWGVYRVELHRGFAEEFHATATAFLRRGAAWAERTPLRDVRLTATAGRVTNLATCRHLAAVRGLTIYDRGFGDADLTALAEAPSLGGLRSLSIGGCGNPSRGQRDGSGVSSQGVENFARAIVAPSLTRLHICPRRALARDALAALLSGRSLPALRSLALTMCVNDEGARAIAAGAAFPKMEELDLDCNAIGEGAMLSLLDPVRAERLRTLHLNYNPVSEYIVDRISAVKLPPSLRVLRLPWDALLFAGAEAIQRLRGRHPIIDFGLDPQAQRADTPVADVRVARYLLNPLFPAVG